MATTTTLEAMEDAHELNQHSARVLVEYIAKDDDDLSAIYALDLARRFCTSAEVLDMLMDAGIGPVMTRILQNGHENELVRVRVPAVLEFAATALQFEGSVEKLEATCHVLGHLDEYIESADQSIKMSALSALADMSLCRSNEEYLLANEQYVAALGKLAHAASLTGKADTQVHALNCIAATLTRLSDAASERTFTILNRDVINGERLLPRLIRLMRSPFDDIVLSTHACLAAICHHPWGRQLLDGQPGFFEVVTDRNSVRSYDVAVVRHRMFGLFTENKEEGIDQFHRGKYAQLLLDGTFAKDVEPVPVVETES